MQEKMLDITCQECLSTFQKSTRCSSPVLGSIYHMILDCLDDCAGAMELAFPAASERSYANDAHLTLATKAPHISIPVTKRHSIMTDENHLDRAHL